MRIVRTDLTGAVAYLHYTNLIIHADFSVLVSTCRPIAEYCTSPPLSRVFFSCHFNELYYFVGGLRHNRGGVNTLLSHSCVKGNNETLGTEFMPWSHAGDSNRPIRRASESAATTRPHKVNGRRAYYQSQKTVTSQSLF